MLSAESAAGKYPLEAVTFMNSIIRSTETDPAYRGILHSRDGEPEATGAEAISADASQDATTSTSAARSSHTMSGATALRVAHQTPNVSNMVLTNGLMTASRHAVPWGDHCVSTGTVRKIKDREGR